MKFDYEISSKSIIILFLDTMVCIEEDTKIQTTIYRKPTDQQTYRSSHPNVFLKKGALRTYSKFTGEHPCRSVISVKFLCKFIEIALWHGCSPVNLLHIFRTLFTKNTSGRLLLKHTCTQNQITRNPLKIVFLTAKLCE